MSSLIRPRLLAAATLLLALAGGSLYLGSTSSATTDQNPATRLAPPSRDTGSHNLILGSKDGKQPESMEQFLTAVTKDVDTYWTKTF